METVEELLARARQAVASGEKSFRAAAEDIADAQKQGATQRQIADSVGRSPAWVNRLLAWRKSGYKDATAFGPQSRAARLRAHVQPAKHYDLGKENSAERADQAAEAEAARATSDVQQADANAIGDAVNDRARACPPYSEANAQNLSQGTFRQTRERLVKALGMLGSLHHGERASAALVVEKLRVGLGMTWEELIIADLIDTQANAA